MNFSIEITQAIEWTIRIVSVCILIDSVEKFQNIKEYYGEGIFSWERVRLFHGFTIRRKFIRRFADSVLNFRVWVVLFFLRGLAAFALLFLAGQNIVSPIGLMILFIVGSLENFRRMPFSPETPNRFTLLIIGGLFLQSVVPTELVTNACMWFIALQSSLSYATAGIAKLTNKEWRKGLGVFNAVNSPYYFTSLKLAKTLDRTPLFAKFLNYFTIIIESLFPLVFVVGKPYYLIFLVWGIFFHLMNAYFLRLNNYFWTWIATYPAIIYIAQS